MSTIDKDNHVKLLYYMWTNVRYGIWLNYIRLVCRAQLLMVSSLFQCRFSPGLKSNREATSSSLHVIAFFVCLHSIIQRQFYIIFLQLGQWPCHVQILLRDHYYTNEYTYNMRDKAGILKVNDFQFLSMCCSNIQRANREWILPKIYRKIWYQLGADGLYMGWKYKQSVLFTSTSQLPVWGS